MAEIKTTTTATTPTGTNAAATSFFSKDNYLWMAVGIIIIAIGMFLMVGGASKDPNVFLRDEVYSSRRITVAPLLILAGLIIEIFAIFRKPKG